jgi:hypothetical protein
MKILQQPQPPNSPPPAPRQPAPSPSEQKYTTQEDVYRGSAAALSSVAAKLSKNSRALGHAADAGGALGINHVAFHTAMGVASLGLGVIDVLQAREAFEKDDSVLGYLNVLGGISNAVGGTISLGEAWAPQPGLASYGALAMSVGVAADATEDLVEAARLQRPDFRPRAYVKFAGAGILLAGALSGDPTVQMVGNLVCVGGVVLHHTPGLLPQK